MMTIRSRRYHPQVIRAKEMARAPRDLGIVISTVRRSITRNGVEVFLSPQLFEIFLIISRARYGVTPTRLFDAIYAGNPNGGPLTGRRTIHVQRRNLNRKIAPLGLHIKSAGSGFRDRAYEFAICESAERPDA
jgi:hypothetical protein